MKIMDEEESFEILGGTYEEFTVGYEFTKRAEGCSIKHTIATHSHRASLKCIAVYNGPKHDLLVTGGTDEAICIYDLRYKKESGVLMNHSGTVTCLRFTPDGSHLLSAGEDGAINIFKIGSWFLEKTWPKSHGGASVLYLSIHPSGKLALSIGADKTLRTWNLVKGRPAYTINLTRKVKQPELVEWSLNGDYYGLVDVDTLSIFKLEQAGELHKITGSSSITDICFAKEDKVCVAYWSGLLTCYSCLTGEKTWELSGDVRLKAVTYFQDYLISVDGQGKIVVYDSHKDGKPKKKAQYESSCRITCITVSKLLREEERPPKKVKRKAISNYVIPIKEESDNDTKRTRKSDSAFSAPQSQKWVVEDIKS